MKRSNAHKILIVDDEEKNRKVLRVMLQNYGYQFTTAANGAEALSRVRDYAPDLIFLDIMTPCAVSGRTSRPLITTQPAKL